MSLIKIQKYEAVSASYISPLCFCATFTCHTLFFVGHDSQKIFVPVEVSSPDVNFDILETFFGKALNFRI
jgi:hypothetical protein